MGVREKKLEELAEECKACKSKMFSHETKYKNVICSLLGEYDNPVCKFNQGYLLTEEGVYHRCVYKEWHKRRGFNEY